MTDAIAAAPGGEADGNGGWDPKNGKMLATNWVDPEDGGKVYVQYIQGGGDLRIVDNDVGHIPADQTGNKMPFPKHLAVK